MKYEPGDTVEARNYEMDGRPWVSATLGERIVESGYHHVTYDLPCKGSRRICLHPRDIRPRPEPANAT